MPAPSDPASLLRSLSKALSAHGCRWSDRTRVRLKASTTERGAIPLQETSSCSQLQKLPVANRFNGRPERTEEVTDSPSPTNGTSPAVTWLVLVVLAAGAFAYWQQASEKRASEMKQQELRRELEAEQQRHLQETLDVLADQAERERCQEYVRAMAPPVMAPEPFAGEQAAMYNMTAITVCSNPNSAIRQRLRSSR